MDEGTRMIQGNFIKPHPGSEQLADRSIIAFPAMRFAHPEEGQLRQEGANYSKMTVVLMVTASSGFSSSGKWSATIGAMPKATPAWGTSAKPIQYQ